MKKIENTFAVTGFIGKGADPKGPVLSIFVVQNFSKSLV